MLRRISRSVSPKSLAQATSALLTCHPDLATLQHPAIYRRDMKQASKPKKPREKLPDYCDVKPKQDDSGEVIWPAPKAVLDQARAFIKEWYGNDLCLIRGH